MPIPDDEYLILPIHKIGNTEVTSFKDAASKLSDEFSLSEEDTTDV